MRRAEQYIKAHEGLPLRTHTPATVTGHLEGLARIGRLEGAVPSGGPCYTDTVLRPARHGVAGNIRGRTIDIPSHRYAATLLTDVPLFQQAMDILIAELGAIGAIGFFP